MYKKIMVSDLDGTLINGNKIFENKIIDTLNNLNKFNILRIIATGRNLFSANKILYNSFPIDYLVFSSGVGIIRWKDKEIIKKNSFSIHDRDNVLKVLFSYKLDFMAHKNVPLNHHFYFHKIQKNNTDFDRRLTIYKDFAIPLTNKHIDSEISQFVIIIDNSKLELYNILSNQMNNYNVILTTSPLDGHSYWIEIYPKNVSKSHACNFLMNKYNISKEESFAIGNDYNDIDLLDWSKYSYVVDNAPTQLKEKYIPVKSCNDAGFYHAIKDWLKINI